jgi:hypothetical protein
MPTIRLKVNQKVYDHLMWFLNRFRADELQIIEEDAGFESAQKELTEELAALEKKEVQFINLDQLDQELEATIRKHEA